MKEILAQRTLQDHTQVALLVKIVHINEIMIDYESTPKVRLEATVKDAIEEITKKKLGFTAIIDSQKHTKRYIY